MAEAVGFVASIIAVAQGTQAVAESVRRAIEPYRAPAEIQTLQVG